MPDLNQAAPRSGVGLNELLSCRPRLEVDCEMLRRAGRGFDLPRSLFKLYFDQLDGFCSAVLESASRSDWLDRKIPWPQSQLLVLQTRGDRRQQSTAHDNADALVYL